MKSPNGAAAATASAVPPISPIRMALADDAASFKLIVWERWKPIEINAPSRGYGIVDRCSSHFNSSGFTGRDIEIDIVKFLLQNAMDLEELNIGQHRSRTSTTNRSIFMYMRFFLHHSGLKIVLIDSDIYSRPIDEILSSCPLLEALDLRGCVFPENFMECKEELKIKEFVQIP